MIKKVIVLGLALPLILASCSQNTNKSNDVKQKIESELEVDEDLMQDLNKAKQVFYALPSPIETAMLIKRAGTEYNENLLNPTTNAINYTSSRDKALNFGVYGADLSYCGLFSQTQTAIDYMAISKKLADEMGILDFLEANFVERLEKNVNNRDSSMVIITEGFMNSNIYLKEAGRPEIAALIITGGWIEGLYIATSLAKESPNNSELIDRIIDQKLSLVTLLSLLEDYDNNADVQYVVEMVSQIKDIYDQIQIVTSKVEPVTSDESNITTLQAKTEIFISDEIFASLLETVDRIRNEIIGI